MTRLQIGTRPYRDALHWQLGLAQKAEVSDHHWRSVASLWPLIESLGITSALEVGAGEPPYLTARMLREHGVRCDTLDAVAEADITADVHSLPLEDGSYDLVVARHVLEHVLCPYVALREMARVSRRWLLVIVPFMEPRFRDWPDHLWYMPADGWQVIFRHVRLRVISRTAGDFTQQGRIDEGYPIMDREYRFLLEKGESK